MSTALARAIYQVSDADLRHMVLTREQLGEPLGEFAALREGVLDNGAMASHGFAGSTAEGLRGMGRVTGYMREFGNREPGSESREGTDLAAATVVHLFDDEAKVGRWMTEVFVKEFLEHQGQTISEGVVLERAEELFTDGFADQAVGLRAVHLGPMGRISSTVVDFRLGRILGVCYVVSAGDCDRLTLTQQMARFLERQIVRVALGAA